ncbi:MAG: hypothetical protein QHH06_06895 [Clostridiales bacterium]|nr:hypothetical protein [Eubacteriales bacterium]MDH7566193.1 hypothetical protein [Clostridiales bacterium]
MKAVLTVGTSKGIRRSAVEPCAENGFNTHIRNRRSKNREEASCRQYAVEVFAV